jgi:hypothetical protein
MRILCVVWIYLYLEQYVLFPVSVRIEYDEELSFLSMEALALILLTLSLSHLQPLLFVFESGTPSFHKQAVLTSILYCSC